MIWCLAEVVHYNARGSQLKNSSYARQKITKKISKSHKKIKKSQKISKNLFKFNMGEIVKIKKSSKKSESSKFWEKNQKIFVHPRTELRTLAITHSADGVVVL